MSVPTSQPAPAYPNFLRSLLAGFDQISKHSWLVLFPVVLDVLIWLGPHISLTNLIQSFSQQVLAVSRLQLAQDSDLMQANSQLWEMLAERFNLMIALRSYPVGIPSVMAGRMPIESPLGQPVVWEVKNTVGAIGLWLVISVIGLLIGTLFYQIVAQATLDNQVNLRSALAFWPRSLICVLGVTLSLVLVYVIVTLPASCLLMIASFTGVGQCIFFGYTVLLVWLLFPFFLSGHGIFVNRDSVTLSIMRGARITRLLVLPTSLLFVVILSLTQVLALLWNVTYEDSWLTLIGILGHAFVTTGLLAGTFVYYRDADRWIRSL